MNLFTWNRTPTRVKIHRITSNGKFRAEYPKVQKIENGAIIVKLRNDEALHILPEVSPNGKIAFYYSHRRFGRVWEPMEWKTWFVREGIGPAITFDTNGSGARANPISDLMLNTLLDTKVLQDIVMADMLAQEWKQIKMYILITLGVATFALLVSGGSALQHIQLEKMLSGVP